MSASCIHSIWNSISPKWATAREIHQCPVVKTKFLFPQGKKQSRTCIVSYFKVENKIDIKESQNCKSTNILLNHLESHTIILETGKWSYLLHTWCHKLGSCLDRPPLDVNKHKKFLWPIWLSVIGDQELE